jgi:hypothetical protein
MGYFVTAAMKEQHIYVKFCLELGKTASTVEDKEPEFLFWPCNHATVYPVENSIHTMSNEVKQVSSNFKNIWMFFGY